MVPANLILDKILGLLVMPVTLFWILLGGLTIRAFLRPLGTRERVAFVVAFGGFTLLGNAWLANGALGYLEGQVPRDEDGDGRTFDAVFVLGGGTRSGPDGSPELNRQGDRVMRGARLYFTGRTPLLVSSGSSIPGLSPPRDHAADTARIWSDLGVPAGAIRMLPEPRNTRQEVAEYKALVEKEGWRRIGIVSSAWHLPRVLGQCRRQGLDVTPISADHTAEMPPLSFMFVIPRGESFLVLTLAAWEIIGALAGH